MKKFVAPENKMVLVLLVGMCLFSLVSVEQVKGDKQDIVLRFIIEVHNNGKLDVADEVFVTDKDFQQRITEFRDAFCDPKFVVEEANMVVEGNKIVVPWTFRGTHKVFFTGLNPTNKEETVMGTTTFHINDGVIQKISWGGLDRMDLIQQVWSLLGLSFDHDKHYRWYRRFWTGSCEGLGFMDFCAEGKPSSDNPRRTFWYDIVDQVLEKVSPQEKNRLNNKLWYLGRIVGHEWAKDNDIRKINSFDIKRWGDMLKKSNNNLEEILNQIEAEANGKLGR